MKKLLIALCVVVAFFFGKCQCDVTPEQTSQNTELIVDSTTNADWTVVSSAQKDSSIEVRFYESEITLNKSVADTTTGTTTPIIVRNIIQANDTCWEFTHFTDKNTSVVKYNDYWMEDATINLDSIKISLDSALVLLAKANIVKPNSKFVTLRQPLNPKFKEPLYIFGKTVSVNAVNGKVETFK